MDTRRSFAQLATEAAKVNAKRCNKVRYNNGNKLSKRGNRKKKRTTCAREHSVTRVELHCIVDIIFDRIGSKDL